jgi:hypothetical protein
LGGETGTALGVERVGAHVGVIKGRGWDLDVGLKIRRHKLYPMRFLITVIHFGSLAHAASDPEHP